MLADEIARKYLRLVHIKDAFVSAACPFHKGGQERRPSFWIERGVGRWGCFSCSRSGEGLGQLLIQMGVSNKSLEAHLKQAEAESKKQAVVDRVKKAAKNRAEFKGEYELPESLLGVFDWAPISLIEAGFNEEVLKQHDIGYDQRTDRITFPIRDIFGTLIGISGRAVDDVEPKYLVYSGRRTIEGREVLGELGEWYPEYSNEGIRDHLWRGNFVYPALINSFDGQLIIVEGYKAALWLVQHGWTNTVALMGSHISKAQERIIRRLGAELFVFLDNNEPGRTGSKQICQRLGVSTFPVYECHYLPHHEESTQPDDLSEAELEEVLSTAQRVGGRFYEFHELRNASSRQSRPTRAKEWRR